MACLRNNEITTGQVAEELDISQRRVQQLSGHYLAACAQGKESQWGLGHSGGNRHKQFPLEVEGLWKKMLKADPSASYSFAASEALRRLGFETDRATVRRWAFLHGLAHSKPPKERAAHIRRWQCQQIGALWQLDVSPHPWFGPEHGNLPLFDLIDDCSRVMTGTRLYPRESLLAYLDFLSQSFAEYGLPLVLYVDYHSFFFSQLPDALTTLGEALHFYDISFKYAPTPQAKGKVERQHQFWQNRLPSYFSSESIHQIPQANVQIQSLRTHHNECEIHRELQMTPQQAWKQALREHRSALRPRPSSRWWPYIWSLRTTVKVDIDGTVPVGTQRVKTNFLLGKRLTRCEHPDGSFTFLANPPSSGGKPIVLLRYENHPSNPKT